MQSNLTEDPDLRGLKVPLGRPVGLQVGLVLPRWAAKLHFDAKLGCQGTLGRHSGLQLGVQVPSQSAPDPSEPRSRAHENANSANCLLCSPSALGLLLGSCWGLLGRLLGSTWSLLRASWAQLGVLGAPLDVILGPPGRLLGSTWASWAPPGPTWGPLGAKWAPNGRLLDAKWTPSERQVGLPQRLQISTHSLRTSQQLPNPTEHLASSTFCRRMATLCNTSIYIYIYIAYT